MGWPTRLLVLGSLLLASAVAAASPPRWIHLSFAGHDAPRTAGVTWHTDGTDDPTQVQYGVAPLWDQFATGTVTMGPQPLGAIHEVVLKDLQPGVEYRYRVGGEGSWSQEFRFRTPPDDLCTPYSFGILGDNRSDDDSGPSPRWFPIITELLQEDPLFVLNSGDIVHNGDQAKQWANWLEASDQTLAVVPHMPTLGNHDDGPEDGDGAHYNRLFNLPRNDVTGTEDYYFFATGNAIFVSLSTQTFKDFAAQAAWLDRVLTENPRLWKFVFFHHPTYTSHSLLGLLDISHEPNEQGQNPHYTAVFDKHHVDFVFYGHNHFYERFEAMRGNGDEEEGIPVGDPAKGTQYVVTGGAGALAYNIAVGLFCGSAQGSRKCSGNHHFLTIELAGNRLSYRARSTAQQLLAYNASNSKDIEVFSYTKEWPGGKDPCLETPIEPVPETAAEAPPEAPPEVAPEVPPEEPAPDVPPPPPDVPPDLPSPPRDEGAPPDDAPPPADLPVATDAPATGGKKGGGCAAGASPGASGLSAAVAFLLAIGWAARRRSRFTGK